MTGQRATIDRYQVTVEVTRDGPAPLPATVVVAMLRQALADAPQCPTLDVTGAAMNRPRLAPWTGQQ